MLEMHEQIFEEVSRIVADAISAKKNDRISISQPKLKESHSSRGAKNLEIEVSVFADGNLEDRIEFHVIRDGLQKVSFTEASEWFSRELQNSITDAVAELK